MKLGPVTPLFKSLACLKTRDQTFSAAEASSKAFQKKVRNFIKLHRAIYFPDLFPTSLPNYKVFLCCFSIYYNFKKGFET